MSLAIAIGQPACTTDTRANRETARAIVTASRGADLVVLPEYCQAFDPRAPAASLAEPLTGPFASRLSALAATHGRMIVAGMLEDAGGDKPFNTVLAAGAGGVAGTYRKIHLYDAFGARESATVAPGDATAAPLVFELAGLRAGVLTCYDLRFGESAARLARAGVNLILVPAAWAAGPHKAEHWVTLLRARAIEHKSWVAGAAMAGPGVIGHSLLIDPMGQIVADAGPQPCGERPVIEAVIGG